ncbi:MAG: tetratricopeptide repeat protein [Pseudomonadota bacterium]
MPNLNQSLTGQVLLAFIFGVVFLGVLLVIAYVTPTPTPFQEWIYRVVMALAAGGVGAVIPGFLDVKISNWIRAGGALACFVIVFLVNPPLLATQKLRDQSYFDLMDRGTTALAAGNTSLAKYLYAGAVQLAPDAYLPYVKLASAEFDSGEFKNAELNYKRAFQLSYPSDSTLLYGAALSEEALGSYELAVQTFEAILAKMRQTDGYAQDLQFSISQLKLKIWLEAHYKEGAYQEAVDGFKAFLEANGAPTYWAHYHLACLYASRSALSQTPEREKSSLVSDAVNELKATVQALRTSRAKKADTHKQMFESLLIGDVANPAPGNPVPCPSLKSLAQQQFPFDKSKLVGRL